MKSKEIIRAILQDTPITLNGPKPWDPQIKNEKFYDRVLRHGSLGLGESYMDGWWECDRLDEFFNQLLRAHIDEKIRENPLYFARTFWRGLIGINQKRAFQVGEEHYNIGNDLYRLMLDPRLVYTCGYWHSAQNLTQAQEAKLDLICRKIGLQRGQRVLDIGSGWGSFIKYAAEKYDAQCLGITVSTEQKKLADQLTKGLPVKTEVKDYRDVEGTFDHIVSIGMFEHVGPRNYRQFFQVARRVLKDDGLFLLHTIGSDTSRLSTDPWIDKYIFPNGSLPSLPQITKACEGLFIIEDIHNFGTDYDKTLMAWFDNFDRHYPQIKEKYNKRFYRMWKYYLLSSAGSFRARKNQLWQIVLSPRDVDGGYRSVR